jgi:site-specific DNA-cytosine methylase
MTAYYNEHDRAAATWLRELIKDGLIADGEVDERSIEDVLPNELAGFAQCHFFAGIGGWSLALRLAGWSDERRVWTGSCPCQPFSTAGKGAGVNDERHLWPHMLRLIKAAQPAIFFGEQVASAINSGVNDEEMFCMLNDETPIRVQEIWGEIKGWSAPSLQSMSARVRKEMEVGFGELPQGAARKTSGNRQDLSGGVYRAGQGEVFNRLDIEKMSEKGNSFRSEFAQGRAIGSTFANEVRDYWISTEGITREVGLQQSFDRQNRPGEGVYLQQRKNSLIRDKCGDGGVGSGKVRSCNKLLEEILNDIRGIAKKTGTQFTGKVTHGWFDDVSQGLEAQGYAVGAAVLPASAAGRGHSRDRLFFVGDTEHYGQFAAAQRGSDGATILHNQKGAHNTGELAGTSDICVMADPLRCGRQGQGKMEQPFNTAASGDGEANKFVDAGTGMWWIECPDGYARPVEPSIPMLAYGLSKDLVGCAARGFGNAIVPEVGAAFIEAYLASVQGRDV